MSFTEDTRTENYLRYHGIKHEYVDSIRFDELRTEWRANNFGRDGDIDHDAVLDYSCRMEAGSPAPAVIVIHTSDGYSVLDGVQRLHGAETIGATTFAAYVVSTRTGLAKQHLIRITSNGAINGQHTPDKKYLLVRAVEVLYFEDKCSVAEVAKAVARSPEKVREEIRFQKTSRMMESIGYSGKLGSSKWFCSEVGKAADESDWAVAPGPLKKMLDVFEACKFKNGAANELIQEFFTVKRSARKDRHKQFQNKVSELLKAPQVKLALGTDKGKSYIGHVLPALRRADRTLHNALEKDEIIHDQDFAIELANALKSVGQACRQLVPRDLQFLPGKKTSIFDKY